MYNDAYPIALLPFEGRVGQVGKLGTIMVGALGTDGSSDPMAPRQSSPSDFSVEVVSFFFSSLLTVMIKMLEANTFVEGIGAKTRIRMETKTRTKTRKGTRTRDSSIKSLSSLRSGMKQRNPPKTLFSDEVFLRFIVPPSLPLSLSLFLFLSRWPNLALGPFLSSFLPS